MQNGKHCAVVFRIEKFIDVPAGGQRSSLGFAIADNATHQQVGVIESRAGSVAQRVSEFAAFVNRTWRFRRVVAGNSTGEGKLFKQALHAFFALPNIGI
jgi:hypothetical protein